MTNPIALDRSARSARRRQDIRAAFRRWGVSGTLSILWFVVLLISMAALPTIMRMDPDAMNAAIRLQGPSWAHLLGTDNYGRDLLARVLAGARVSLWIGFGSVAAAALIGIPIGMLSAYLRGKFDAIASFVVDSILAFPGLILALALAAFLGASITNVMIAIAVPMAPVFARLAKAQTLSVAGADYVEASQVIGTPTSSIMRRDVLPNIAEAMLAFGLVSVGNAILIEGGLSFLGLGVPPTQASWGSMINYGRGFLTTNPLIVAVPSAFMLLSILALNIIADRYLEGSVTKAGI